MICPRCAAPEHRQSELQRPFDSDPADYNEVYRCRDCGHIYSPKGARK